MQKKIIYIVGLLALVFAAIPAFAQTTLGTSSIDREITYFLQGGTTRQFQLDVAEDVGYTIEVTSDDFDPVLRVYSLTGATFTFGEEIEVDVYEDDDDGTTLFDSLLSIVPANFADSIMIEITSYDGVSGGNFNMIVSRVPEDIAYSVTETGYEMSDTGLCNPDLTTRFPVAGQTGGVVDGFQAQRVRLQPGLSSDVIGYLTDEFTFITLGSPVCRDGYYWLPVRRSDGKLEGWTAEGRGGVYWVEPLG